MSHIQYTLFNDAGKAFCICPKCHRNVLQTTHKRGCEALKSLNSYTLRFGKIEPPFETIASSLKKRGPGDGVRLPNGEGK